MHFKVFTGYNYVLTVDFEDTLNSSCAYKIAPNSKPNASRRYNVLVHIGDVYIELRNKYKS